MMGGFSEFFNSPPGPRAYELVVVYTAKYSTLSLVRLGARVEVSLFVPFPSNGAERERRKTVTSFQYYSYFSFSVIADNFLYGAQSSRLHDLIYE